MRNLDFSTKVFRLLMLVLLLFSVQMKGGRELSKGELLTRKVEKPLLE